jgi:hypothetical protein
MMSMESKPTGEHSANIRQVIEFLDREIARLQREMRQSASLSEHYQLDQFDRPAAHARRSACGTG